MAPRMSPLMWPLLALASPVLVPKMVRRNRTFKENRSRAESLNHWQPPFVETEPLAVRSCHCLDSLCAG